MRFQITIYFRLFYFIKDNVLISVLNLCIHQNNIRPSFQTSKIGYGLGRKARKGITKGGATFAFRWFHITRYHLFQSNFLDQEVKCYIFHPNELKPINRVYTLIRVYCSKGIRKKNNFTSTRPYQTDRKMVASSKEVRCSNRSFK